MNPIGLALAFALFWVLVGIGLFLIIWMLTRVVKANTAVGLTAASGSKLRGRDLLIAAIILPLAGIMIYLGLAASLNTVFR